ncbi:MAG: AAA family ATPase, partial [Firmicutes bacterium]|nr:AAA family ATPase [Bacillota bacterium]
MQIHQLRLINVKSYVDETLEFQPGINFISGINGAGKSTIIESLGYALFDYNPYVLRQFLREGASQGEIQVLIEGSDERLYRVIRKFTAGSSIKWEVWDEETSAMLDELHGSEDVKIWLKRAMGVAPGDDLSDLFRQVIAVQQGQFTTPFLEIPSSRTQIFDAVLKVEDYRKAFTQT